MTSTQARLIARLADGELHSGEALAAELSVSRSAVWKIVGQLNALGVEIHSTARRGYRMAGPVELLDAARIRSGSRRLQESAPDFALAFLVESTSERLFAEPPPLPGHWRVLLAELQTAGRGRRGREWRAPFGSGLTFSVGWSFAETPADLSALSLAMGVVVLRALRTAGAHEVGLKWPNDIVSGARKLGGLLVQLRSESGGPAYVVVGVGLNISLPAAQRIVVDSAAAWPAGDLRDSMGAHTPGRNALAAALIDGLCDGLAEFGSNGFAAFAADYARWDVLDGTDVRVLQGDATHEGVARGADRDGALRVEIEGRLRRFVAGEVSVRRGGPV